MTLHDEIRVSIFSGGNGDCIRVLEDLLYVYENLPPFTVPAGFESDGASVPEFLWATVSPAIDPRTLDGALAHDYLYRTCPQGWTRKAADGLFYDYIRAHGLSFFRSQKAYWGVRLFGGKSWRKKEEQDKEMEEEK